MYHAIEELLGHRMPRLVVLHVAMVGMMRAVADAPSVVRHKDGRVHDVANEVVQGAVVRKALGRNIEVVRQAWRSRRSRLYSPGVRSHVRPQREPRTWYPGRTSREAMPT